ncbi:MAG: zf-HC2 domain-containing protein [Bacteroidota bacterium]
MTHRTVRRLLSARLDGEGDPSKESGVHEHLEQCEECRAYEDGMRSLRAGLRSLNAEMPGPELLSGVLRRTRLAQEEYKLWSPVELVARRFVAGLAAAVLIFVSLAMIAQPDEPMVIEPYLAGEQNDSSSVSLLARDVISNDDLLLAAASRK